MTMAEVPQTGDRTAVCPLCGTPFPVNPRHTITKRGVIYVFGHRKPDGEVCMSNGAKIPNYKPRPGDLPPIGERW